MNETAFSGYYCSTAYQQPPELSTPIHNMWEHEANSVPTIGNGSLGFEDEHLSFFSNNSVHSEHNEFSLLKAPESSSSSTNDLPSLSTAISFTNIPFVQIHTTELHPTNKSDRSSFRRRAAEIKSEPIKSEQTDSSKECAHATPTPPARNASNEGSTELGKSNVMPMSTASASPEVQKCLHCAYLTLSNSNLQIHISAAHPFGSNLQDSRTLLKCPGCTNNFYSFNSLEAHLREDHMMLSSEIATLLFALNQKEISSTDVLQSKRGIYIKNVDCLRELNSSPMEEESDLLSNNYFRQSDELQNNDVLDLIDEALSASMPVTKPAEPTKQKISIKSVDVLREPALLQNQYQLAYDALRNDDALLADGRCDNANTFANGLGPTQCDIQQQETVDQKRRPKIYIKNVDILKEPMLLPTNLNSTIAQNVNCSFPTASVVQNVVSTGGYQTGPELLTPITTTATINNYDPNLPDLQSLSNIAGDTYLYEPTDNNFTVTGATSESQNGTTTTNYLSNCNNVTANLNAESFNLNNVRFMNDLEYGIGDLIETDTPSPPQHSVSVALPGIDHAANNVLATEKQKIFIKNVDILKAPQFQQSNHQQQQQHQRGTLHLRTVDELNLMNRNEVENLIAPNLESHPNVTTSRIENPAVEHVTVPMEPVADDFGAEFPDGWSNDDFALSDNLDCIIDDGIDPLISLVKPGNCAESTLLAVRDANELNSGSSEMVLPDTLDTWSQMAEDILQEDFQHIYIQPESEQNNDVIKPDNVVMLQPASEQIVFDNTSTTSSAINMCDIPPLVPVTMTTRSAESEMASTNTTQNLASIAVPPLVPCAPPALLQLSKADKSKNISDKQARIYVSNNLLESAKEPKSSVPQIPAGGTSVRGRPYGAKCTGVTKLRKQNGCSSAEAQVGSKCKVNGCAFRFKSPKTLEYHKRCHNDTSGSNPTHSMICPECQSTEFSHWNSLHTHLWRSHKIDMELYSCHLCSFKTPIYSRLKNTHTKIHSEERNYKCDQCGKAFKNTKQLKNHRRWHRYQTVTKPTASSNSMEAPTLHRCTDCGAAFSHQKSLREHLCKNREEQLNCDVCQRQMSSRSALKLHLLTHEEAKRLKCDDCDYKANDHNAFRRHRMTHLEKTMYTCPYCEYKSIQSATYQKHVKQKHPEHADEIVHKCPQCSYSTINRHLFNVHQAKHVSTETPVNPQPTPLKPKQLDTSPGLSFYNHMR